MHDYVFTVCSDSLITIYESTLYLRVIKLELYTVTEVFMRYINQGAQRWVWYTHKHWGLRCMTNLYHYLMKFTSIRNNSFIVITLKWLRFSFQLSDEHIIAFNSLWDHHSLWPHLIQERRSNVMHQLFQFPMMHVNWFLIWFWELYVEAGQASCGSVMCAMIL